MDLTPLVDNTPLVPLEWELVDIPGSSRVHGHTCTAEKITTSAENVWEVLVVGGFDTSIARMTFNLDTSTSSYIRVKSPVERVATTVFQPRPWELQSTEDQPYLMFHSAAMLSDRYLLIAGGESTWFGSEISIDCKKPEYLLFDKDCDEFVSVYCVIFNHVPPLIERLSEMPEIVICVR